MPEKILKIKGKIHDPVLDCGHILVLGDDGFDVLHDFLRQFEGNEIEIELKELNAR